MQTKRSYRDERGLPWPENLLKDLRYGLRIMSKNPGFTSVAIVTLALGIGANTAIFSLLDAVELRSLPVRHPEQLVELHWTAGHPKSWQGRYSSFTGCDAKELGAADAGCSFPYPVYDLFRHSAKSFDGVFAFGGPAGVQALIRGEIAPASAELVSGEFFSTLGVPAQWGRTLNATDDRTGAEPVAVLNSSFWQAHFGGDPKILGKTILLEGAPFRIVGIAPKEFFGLQSIAMPDLWIPVHSGVKLGPGWWDELDSKNAWLSVIGRLKPGIGPGQARAELEVLFRQSLAGVPQFKPDAQPGIALTSAARGLAGLRQRYSRPLQVLMAVVALVLLIACANLANLLLARSSARRKEIAVRLAIGGGRGRLVRQLLTESLLLAGFGGAAGLALAVWVSRVLAAFLTSGMERTLLDVRPNMVVFGFTAVVAGLAAVLFGMAPAISGTRVEPAAALKSGAGVTGGNAAMGGFGRWLVAAEMAMSLVLLIGAGLFLRTLVNLETLDPGFHRDHLLTFVVSPKHDGRNIERRPTLSAELQTRLASIRGVLSATWSSDLLLIGNLESGDMRIGDRSDPGEVHVDILRIGTQFFETMGIPLLSGRTVELADCRAGSDVAWVNQTLAQRYFTGGNPLGGRISNGTRKFQIAGVVGDTKYETLRSEIEPTVYIPARAGGAFTLRTAGDPMALAGAARQVVSEVSPDVLISQMKSESEQVDRQLFTERMMARLSAAFGLLALAMASIGVYGVLAYSVTRRTSEIAIRISLGALPHEIARLILSSGMAPAAAGAAAGLLASYALMRIGTSFLFGVPPLDPLTYGAATFVLLGMAALACYIPARRAARVDPIVALRFE